MTIKNGNHNSFKGALMKQAIILVIMATLFGCASIDKTMSGSGSMPSRSERMELVKQFPEISKTQEASFVDGKPWIGMTQRTLIALLGNEPKKSQRKLSSVGETDVQLYTVRVGDFTTGIRTKYYKATMLDGKLHEFQEIDSNLGNLDNL